MNNRPVLSFLLEMAAAGFMIYSSANPDANYLALLWYAIWKSATTVAQAAGRLGMRAEVRYFETVKL